MPESEKRSWLGELWTQLDQRRLKLSRQQRRRKRRSKLELESLEPRDLLTAVPQLLSDLTGDSASSLPAEFVQSGANTFFTAGGTELWKTNGTSVGTVLLKDFDTGSGNTQYISDLTDVNGTLALGFVDFGTAFPFPAPNSKAQLWKSNGTVGGTVLVQDFGAGSYAGSFSTGAYLTNVNGTLFGVVSTPSFGSELWKSNLQSLGTTMVEDINPGSADSMPLNLLSFNGKLFFSADDGSNGTELWRSDGASGGTILLKDIKPGTWTSGPLAGYPRSSFPSDLTTVDGHFFFGAIDAGADDDIATPADNSAQLWKSDGTSGGTMLVNDFGAGSSSYAPELTNVDGTLFGVVNVPSVGAELWKSNGTSATTKLVRDINPGSGDGFPHNLRAVNDLLFFGARDGSTGTELWKSDGTSDGTMLVKDIRPTTCCDSYDGFYGALTNVNGSVFFRANDGSSGRELWQSDGTAAGTVLVADIDPGSSGSDPYNLANINGTLYFAADDGSVGTEPWLATETSLDFGDAPDPTFPTLQASDGARHALGSGLFLGSEVDVDTEGQPNATATGDDVLDGNDDEDGLTLNSTLVPGQTASFTIESSGAGFVDGWIDVDGDGMWSHPDEQFLESVAVVTGNNNFTRLVPANAAFGTTYIRVRLSSAGGLLPTGLASDGEVEDYQVTIETVNRFVVNSVGNAVDANTGDNLCETATPGECTLRAAMQQANVTSNLAAGPDVIIFDIAGAGPHTIAPTSALPLITQPVVIDGTTEPDFAGTPIIELNGTSAGAGVTGIDVRGGGSGSTIRGLVVNRFKGIGINLVSSSANTVQGNYIGTDVTGTLDRGNDLQGIRAIDGANNTIGGTTAEEGNVISGNDQQGVLIFGTAATGNVVQGNFIGTNAAGTGALGNSSMGVRIHEGVNNTIGGTASGAGNIISGNLSDGIRIVNALATGNVIQGNRIGTNLTGTAAIPNNSRGVAIVNGANGNTIGGTASGAGNQISGNLRHGVLLVGPSTTVQGNLIGTNAAGTAALANSINGIYVPNTGNHMIGGDVAGAGNVISGNGRYGIVLDGPSSSGNVIQGNLIGTNMTGTAAVPNASVGIFLPSAPNNTIGGTTAGAGNTISGNTDHGIVIDGSSASGNQVQGNRIGTNLAGTAAVPNGLGGVRLSKAPNNTIGGTTAGSGNVISGNADDGVRIIRASATGNLVQGNLIGTNAAGTGALPNSSRGVYVGASASNNTIGGTTAGAGNVISGNTRHGVQLDGGASSGSLVQGNLIGTQIDGTTALGNGSMGVYISNSHDNTVGGAAAGAGNTIAFNTRHGVAVFGHSATGNRIQRNAIFNNTILGIDIGSDGQTNNDALDPDTGPNQFQNFPELVSATLSGNNLTINYAVPSSTDNSAYDLSVEFFRADSIGQEGQTFLGAHAYVAAQATNVQQVILDVTGLGVALGQRLLGTATDANGNTSEFTQFASSVAVAAPLLAAGGEQLTGAASDIIPLQATALAPLFDAAITRWQQTGLSAAQLAQLQAVTFEIVDLPGAYVGLATPTTIQLDDTAAGYGWFVDPTPLDDSEFTAPSSNRQSQIDHRQSIDLLTAVMHEMGHVLGLEDVLDDSLAEDIMSAWLQVGQRRLS